MLYIALSITNPNKIYCGNPRVITTPSINIMVIYCDMDISLLNFSNILFNIFRF